MFREMRRIKQQIPFEECIAILKSEPRGVLSMLGDDGYPYGIPLTHWYCEEDDRIYFHCAKVGHKIDAITKCNKVSFCVYDKGFRKEGEWSLNINSVVVFGIIKPVTNMILARKICEKLCRKFYDNDEYIEKEMEKSFSRVLCLELMPEHITGKLVNES